MARSNGKTEVPEEEQQIDAEHELPAPMKEKSSRRASAGF